MAERHLLLAKSYLVKELVDCQDETFPLLFHDISDFAANACDRIYGQTDRRISIHGIRGIGKTTAMQGIMWLGTQKRLADNAIPINVVVSDAMTSNNAKELTDNFHKALLLGVGKLILSKNRKKSMLAVAKRYAPWVASKITETAGVIFGPIALASDLAEKSVKWLVSRFNKENFESLLTSKDVDIQRASSLLLEKLEEKGKPLLIIDELDKVRDDVIVSDFFDGNQSLFQGRNAVISLSYTFGQSLKDTLLTSASRISTIEAFPGVSSLSDAKGIILKRVILGLSQIEEEQHALRSAERIFPDETINALLNVSAPNTFILLERASQAIDKAVSSNSPQVLPDHVYREPTEKTIPSKIELMVLNNLLTSGRLSTGDMAEQVNRDKGQISKVLTRMMSKGWVNRIGRGKRAYYYITPKGEASLKRTRS